MTQTQMIAGWTFGVTGLGHPSNAYAVVRKSAVGSLPSVELVAIAIWELVKSPIGFLVKLIHIQVGSAMMAEKCSRSSWKQEEQLLNRAKERR